MSPDSNKEARIAVEHRKGHLAMSCVFALIWIAAVGAIIHLRDDIPTYMLLIATVFFVMLMPSMYDLVRDYEKFMARLKGKVGTTSPDQ